MSGEDTSVPPTNNGFTILLRQNPRLQNGAKKRKTFVSTDLNGEDSAWIDDNLELEEIDNTQCSRPQFDLDFDECPSCITTTSPNQDVDTESVVISATSDFNFDDNDSLTKMPV